MSIRLAYVQCQSYAWALYQSYRLAQCEGKLEYARARQLTVVPQCPFIASYIRRHQEYVALVDPAYRERVAKD